MLPREEMKKKKQGRRREWRKGRNPLTEDPYSATPKPTRLECGVPGTPFDQEKLPEKPSIAEKLSEAGSRSYEAPSSSHL